ncbi:hypothetical protein GCM10023163_23650 [Aestuariibaculum suncheonense]
MKITYFIRLLFIPFLIYGQNFESKRFSRLESEIKRIDSVIDLTNKTEKATSNVLKEVQLLTKVYLEKMEVGRPIIYTKNKMTIFPSELNTAKLVIKHIKSLNFSIKMRI